MLKLSPGSGVDRFLMVYMMDAKGLAFQPWSGVIGGVDDYEIIQGLKNLGIDCITKLVTYDGRPGAFLSQSIHIRNDPDSCSDRVLLLKEVDSAGKPICSLDTLYDMQLAYPVFEGDQWKLKPCFDPETGEVTEQIYWLKGYQRESDGSKKVVEIDGREYLVPIEVVSIPTQIPESIEKMTTQQIKFKGEGEQGIHYVTRLPGGDVMIDTVYFNLNSINPVVSQRGAYEVSGENEAIWKWAIKSGKYLDEFMYGLFSNAVDGVEAIVGVKPEEEAFINLIRGFAKNQRAANIEILLDLLDGDGVQYPWSWTPQDPVPTNEFISVYEKAWVTPLVKRFASHRDYSFREAWMDVVGEAIVKKCGPSNNLVTKVSGEMDAPIFGSTTMHSIDSKMREGLSIYKLSAAEIKKLIGEKEVERLASLFGDKFKPDKPCLMIKDPVESILGPLPPRTPVYAIPIFKSGSTVGQSTDPTEFYSQGFPSSSVPIYNNLDKLFSQVECYALYYYDKEGEPKYKPYKPLPEVGLPTNIMEASEYAPLSINEVGQGLRILKAIFRLTTDLGSTEQSYEVTSDNSEFLSPREFVEHLEALLYTHPYEALLICEDLGILELLKYRRNIYPILATSNVAQKGDIIHVRDIEADIPPNYPYDDVREIKAFYNLYGLRDIPTDTNLFINWLAWIGAQHWKMNDVYIPVGFMTDDLYFGAFVCGSATFNWYDLMKNPDDQNEEIHPLDYIGIPVQILSDGTKEPFYKEDRKTPKKFKELGWEEFKRVEGVKCREDLSPYDVRKIFGNYEVDPETGEPIYPVRWRIAGVPPYEDSEKTKEQLNQEVNIFSKMTERIRINADPNLSDRQRQRLSLPCFYKVHEYALETVGVTYESPKSNEFFDKGKKLPFRSTLGEAMKMVFKVPLEDRIVSRLGMADEDYQPMFSLQTVMQLVDAAKLAMSEQMAIKMMSLAAEEVHSRTYFEYYEAVKKGDMVALTAMANKINILYLAQNLRSSSSTMLKKIGQTLVEMVDWAETHGKLVELRPEGVLNWFGNALVKTELVEQTLLRLKRNKITMEEILLMDKTMNPILRQQEYQLILQLLEKGFSPDKIAKQVISFTQEEIEQIIDGATVGEDGQIEERPSVAMTLGFGKLTETIGKLQQFFKLFKQSPSKALKALGLGALGVGGGMALGGAIGGGHVAFFITAVAPMLQGAGWAAIAALEAQTMSPLLSDQEGNVYQGGAVTRLTMNPDANIIASILLAAGVYLTDYMELGEGALAKVPSGVDMDWVNVLMAGMQSGMMDLGLCYVSEDTLADLVKPILGLVGIQGGLVGMGIFEAVGLVSCLPQVDQFYKERIWPIVKLSIGAQLMGGIRPIFTSALANTVAMNALSVTEKAFMNMLLEEPSLSGATMDFSAMLEYLPLGGGYDYIGNYISHHIYGVW